ncbi:DNA primase [Rhodococcus phage AppleCloud]|uniref:DNA primase n=1 Tax=Rhodococcus phage AppleCloud TaxID=2015827 RepID=A0A223FZN0_9CAUD|nr:DNA primase [Rhodococcus phage AppleCloud]
MQKLSESQRSYLQEATTRYAQALPGSPAEEYIASRGFLEPSVADSIGKFRLGYVEDPLPGHDMYRGFLAIPYLRWHPRRGWNVVSMRFRCIENHKHQGHGKYMTAPGDTPRLYNTPALLQPVPAVGITEGELDALTATLYGIPTVGVPGAQSWKPHFRGPFLGYREVFVFTDGDDAGRAFAETIGKSLPNARIIPCPEGEDVNSLVMSQGPQALHERIE